MGQIIVPGNAVPGDVLANKKFSAGTYYNSDGTMPNRAGDTAAISSQVVGTTLKLLASQGYRDGVDDYVTIADPNFVAENLPFGMTLFGLTGNGGKVRRWSLQTSTSFWSTGSNDYIMFGTFGGNNKIKAIIVMRDTGSFAQPCGFWCAPGVLTSAEVQMYISSNTIYTSGVFLVEDDNYVISTKYNQSASYKILLIGE